MSTDLSTIKRRTALSFVGLVLTPLLKMIWLSLSKPRELNHLSTTFSELYSKLWDFAEHSISHDGFHLPSALGNGPAHRTNELLSDIYGAKFSSLSFGGSSGALLTLLTAVLPKLQPTRDLILFDDLSHQSTIGGLIFGRWKAIRLPRQTHAIFDIVMPNTFENVRDIIKRHGPEKFAAIILVAPSYDGFRSPSEELKIFQYAKSHGISVIIDGAWDAMRFRVSELETPTLSSICDVWITSPHKRGLTPSSLGCILTNNEKIARLWDEALDLGFRSSSISFVECMIAEHRLTQIASGSWDKFLDKAEEAAKHLTDRIQDIHPNICVITPAEIQAETNDPSHILISTHKIPDLDARNWARTLAEHFAFDVEKATANTLLLLCGSPAHSTQIKEIMACLKQAFLMTLSKHKGTDHDD